MIQNLIVALLVIVAGLASAWKLMPARRRLRALLALDGWLRRRQMLAGWRAHGLAARIRSAAGAGCDGCAANAGLPPNHPRR